LNNVYSLIVKEARECVEKSSFKKKTFNPSADDTLPMWQYVVINSDISNLIAERYFIYDFGLIDHYSESAYCLNAFAQTIEIMKTSLKNDSSKNVNISPIYIQTKTITPETQTDFYNQRSQSMATTSTKISSKENNETLFGSVTSSIKGFFNK
jgi:hypothetical protein